MEKWNALSPWYGLAIFVSVFLAGFLKVNYLSALALQQQVSELQRELSPQLELLFDEEHFRSCRMDRVKDGSIDRILRVVIRNTGGRTIDDVKVQLASVDPQGAPFLPIEMRLMHERSPQALESTRGTTLRPGEVKYADVVAKSQRSAEAVFLYAVSNVPKAIPIREYVVTLRALGRDVPPCEARFRVRPTDDQLLSLEPYGEPSTTPNVLLAAQLRDGQR